MTQAFDLFDRDWCGRTARFYAAEKGLMEEVHRMIFSLPGTGVGPGRLGLIEIADASGLTAIDVAERNGHQEIADLLRWERLRMTCFE